VDPGISTETFDSSIMNLMHNVATMYEIKVIFFGLFSSDSLYYDNYIFKNYET